LVVILAILVVRGPGTDAPAAPPLRSTTSTTLSPEAEVEQAYRAFDAMVSRLNLAPDPEDPEIAQRTTGEFKSQYELVLADRRTRGVAVKTGPRYGPTALTTTVDGSSATVRTCYVDQAATVNAMTGAEIDAMTTVPELITLSFAWEEGTWKLRSLVIKRDARTKVPVRCEPSLLQPSASPP
jgi:hypothetical protein